MSEKALVTATYTRKINHDLYGGFPYENSEFFCSIRREVDAGKEADMFRELSALAKDEVIRVVADEISGLAGGLLPKEYREVLEKAMLGESIGDVPIFEQLSTKQQHELKIISNTRKRLITKGKIKE